MGWCPPLYLYEIEISLPKAMALVGVTVSHESTVEVDGVFLCDMVAPTGAMNK